jgi:hypothetical protein
MMTTRLGSSGRKLALLSALLLAACASGPPPELPPARQSVQPVGLDHTGLACLAEAPEIVAAHHERAPMYGAYSCDTRALDYAGAFGVLGAIAALGMAASCMGPEDGIYVDVASVVRDRFVTQLSPGPLAAKTVSPAACPAGDSLVELRQSFGNEPVIDFKTVDWNEVSAGHQRVFVPATVRGRLLDLSGNRILWEGACTVRSDASAPDLEALRSRLEQSAAACAEQFAEPFTSG